MAVIAVVKRHLVACWRLVRVAAHIVHGVWRVHTDFARLAPAEQRVQVQAWAQELLRRAGIALVVRGTPPAGGPVLLAANHISWLDIPTLHAARHCRFVSKSDIQRWPLVSTLADAAGTLYLERSSRRDALRVVQGMAERLRAGDVLAVFPEGTTSDGRQMLPFHANLLQAAIDADAPVLPVALGFVDRATGRPSYAPSYAGDDTLARSVWRTLSAPPLSAVVHYGEPQHAQGRDRRAWAQALQAEVRRLQG